MDPNELLKKILSNANRISNIDPQLYRSANNAEDDLNCAIDMAINIIDLNDWISKGGFLPKAWKK